MRVASRWRLPATILSIMALVRVAVLAAQPARPEATAPGRLRSIRDWELGCDHARRCEALGHPPEANTDHPAALRIDRDGTPEAAPVVRLLLDGVWGPRSDAPPLPARIRIVPISDGGSTPASTTLLTLDRARIRDGDGAREITFTASEATRLLDTFRHAYELLVVGTRDTDTLGLVSLAGSQATLLAMDEYQRRLGTVTALVRRGDRAAATIPAPSALPVVRVVPPSPALAARLPDTAARRQIVQAVVRAQRAALTPCDRGEGGIPEDGTRDAVAPLDEVRWLVEVACYRGAYNFGSLWFVVPRAAPRQAALASFMRRDAAGREQPRPGAMPATLVNASFDAKAGTLGGLNKGRGLGDCGEIEQWGWTGTHFELLDRTESYACRAIGPAAWVTTYRATRAP